MFHRGRTRRAPGDAAACGSGRGMGHTRLSARVVRLAATTSLVAVCACASRGAGAPVPAKPVLADGPAARPADALPPRTPASPALTHLVAGRGADPPSGIAGPHGELMRAGQRLVTTADLGEFVLRWQPDVARTALRRLALEVLVAAEASREGVEPPADLLNAAADRAFADRVRRLRLEHGTGADVAAVLRRDYGRSETELREDLRRAVRIDLLRERLARLDAMRRDGMELRVLVLADERAAVTAATQWRAGADGGLIARRLGVAGPDAPPAVVPADVPDVRLRERLLAAAPGAVLDPVPFDAADETRPGGVRTWWQVFKVVRSWKATTAPWSDLAAAIEASLRDAPAGDDELAAWEVRASQRAGLSWWDGAKGFRPSVPGK